MSDMKYFKKKAGARPASRNHNAVSKEDQEGMALIDWFAGQAMAGSIFDFDDAKKTARWAYDIAIAMMDKRKEMMEREND